MSHSLDIRAKIKEKMDCMANLQVVYDYEPNFVASGYPAATIKLDRGEGEFIDNWRNFRTHYFEIKVYVDKDPVNGFSSRDAERVGLTCLTEILRAFDRDVTLSGTTTFCRPIDYDTSFDIRETAVRVVDMTLECKEMIFVNYP